jgi:hypothetical protein
LDQEPQDHIIEEKIESTFELAVEIKPETMDILIGIFSQFA